MGPASPPLKAASRGAGTNQSRNGSHFALSPPRDTTARARETGPRGFDFGRAASLLTEAAARAGAAIMRHYHAGAEVELKSDSSPVTCADRDSEAIILAAIAELAPEVMVISEETFRGVEAPLPDRFFLVDPLDGTKEFINKRSDFTVNIALIEGGRARFGLVHAPARALLAVTPEAGRAVEVELPPNDAGANFERLTQKLLHARPVRGSGLTALVSHSHLDAETEAFLAKLDIAERSGVGSSVKFLAIARGEADVYPRFGPTMEWDTAAGQAVLEAAGGSVVGAEGRPLSYGKAETGLRNPSFIAWGRTAS